MVYSHNGNGDEGVRDGEVGYNNWANPALDSVSNSYFELDIFLCIC